MGHPVKDRSGPTLWLIHLSFRLQVQTQDPLGSFQRRIQVLRLPLVLPSSLENSVKPWQQDFSRNNNDKNGSVRDIDEARLSQKAVWAREHNYSYRGLSPLDHRIKSVLGMKLVMVKKVLRNRELSLGTMYVIYAASPSSGMLERSAV